MKRELMDSMRMRGGCLAMVAGLVFSSAILAQPAPTANTAAQEESGLYQALQAWRSRMVIRSSADGRHDTLAEYARKCDEATGITVPQFSCDAGTEVPGQGDIPASSANATHCDRPNVLNRHCDPGSKFQVLPGGNADAVAVAHCRKVGLPIAGSHYNDIAVIQYNKKNGALCFYQALGDGGDSYLPGQHVLSPRDGEVPWDPNTSLPADQRGIWLSPEATERIGCTGCHDNGGFIRSEYLAQLKTPPNVLPNMASGFDNFDTPVRYVGLDFATNRSWSIKAPPAPGDAGPSCTTCHRLAVPNRTAFSRINGTAAHFAGYATAPTQDSKNPHGPSSPIWMRPGQVTYNAAAEASAKVFEACATAFFNSNFVSGPPGCEYTPLGQPWKEAEPVSMASIYYLLTM